MSQLGRKLCASGLGALCGMLVGIIPATSADLYTHTPKNMASEPPPTPNRWQFNFTPYGWLVGVNGNATARGRTVDINASFVDIVEESDSIMALMGFFEARRGAFSFFTDVVWQDLGFEAHRSGSGNPFPNFPNVNLAVKAKAQLGYQSTVVQSGASYQIAKWQGRDGAYTALDLMGSARYWHEELDVSLNVTGTLTVHMAAPERFIAWCKQEQASIEQQLELLQAGKVRTGEDIGAGWIDTTGESIDRAKVRLTELNDLLTEAGAATVIKPDAL